MIFISIEPISRFLYNKNHWNLYSPDLIQFLWSSLNFMIKSLPTNLKKSKTRENFDPKTRENFEAGKLESYERQFWKINPKEFIANFVWNILFNLQRMTNSCFLLVKLGFLKFHFWKFRLKLFSGWDVVFWERWSRGRPSAVLLKLHLQYTLYRFMSQSQNWFLRILEVYHGKLLLANLLFVQRNEI